MVIVKYLAALAVVDAIVSFLLSLSRIVPVMSLSAMKKKRDLFVNNNNNDYY